MNLFDLHIYDDITIQCHDNPDADALATGYALYTYFKELGKKVRLIYSGRFQIQKTNLVAMIDLLQIPITYTTETQISGLLITVDGQYGAGNVTLIKADEVAIIDHHQQENFGLSLTQICSYLGSCSTVLWQMLLASDFDFNTHPLVSTALYYGLYIDTNQFAELYHPLDKDMRDDLKIDSAIINRLKNSNLSLDEIEVAGLALIRYHYDDIHRYALIKARPCDPNILGVISDMMLQVDCVDTCVVYNILDGGVKLSIRSCIKEVKASELAHFLTDRVGSGGGHLEKAGGFISDRTFRQQYPEVSIETYLLTRLNDYFKSYDIIEALTYTMDMSDMKLYQKLQLPVGFVEAHKLLSIGTPVVIRTLEGDIDFSISEDIYIMIGIDGEVYPIRKEKFERSYSPCQDTFSPINLQYFPSIKNKISGETIGLKSHAAPCLPKGSAQIYAKLLHKTVKVFTAWDSQKYMLGHPGDYIATRPDDPHDIYIIRGDIMERTYELAIIQ